MKFESFMRSVDGKRIMLELTSGRPISGEVIFVGDDFLGVKIHPEHDTAEIVPFTSVATIHNIDATGFRA